MLNIYYPVPKTYVQPGPVSTHTSAPLSPFTDFSVPRLFGADEVHVLHVRGPLIFLFVASVCHEKWNANWSVKNSRSFGEWR